MLIALIALIALPATTGAAVFFYIRYRAEQRRNAELTQLIDRGNKAMLDLMAQNIRLRRRPIIINSRLYHAYRIDPASIHRN